jgi:hypothetical protein
MSIHFHIAGQDGTAKYYTEPCFRRLIDPHAARGELKYIHYFPFSDGDGECSINNQFGTERGNLNLPMIRQWWQHVLSKRFITECLVYVPNIQEILEGSGFKVKCDISYRRMMVVLSILRSPQVLMNQRVKVFSLLLGQGIEADTAFLMSQVVCSYEVCDHDTFTIATNLCCEHDVFSAGYMTSDDVKRFLKIWSGDYKASDLPRSIMYSKTKTYHRYEAHNPKAIVRYFTRNNYTQQFEESFLGDMYYLVNDSGLRLDMNTGRLRGKQRNLSLGQLSTISGHIKTLKGAQ